MDDIYCVDTNEGYCMWPVLYVAFHTVSRIASIHFCEFHLLQFSSTEILDANLNMESHLFLDVGALGT